MTKIILFNGPPRSGKNTATEIFCHFFVAKQFCFAEELKDATHGLFGIRGVRHDYFEDRKDIKLPEFMGMTPREAYIWVAENILKAKFGQEYLGIKLAKRIKDYNYPRIAISDSGFVPEAMVLVREFGAENISVVHMFRPGYTFKNDSRGYIHLNVPGINYFLINNIGDLDKLKQEVEKIGKKLGL